MLNQGLVLGLVACANLALAVPVSVGADLHARAADVNQCPGYEASNVVNSGSSITASLTLAGPACNLFTDDIKELKLLVEYQSSESQPQSHMHCSEK